MKAVERKGMEREVREERQTKARCGKDYQKRNNKVSVMKETSNAWRRWTGKTGCSSRQGGAGWLLWLSLAAAGHGLQQLAPPFLAATRHSKAGRGRPARGRGGGEEKRVSGV